MSPSSLEAYIKENLVLMNISTSWYKTKWRWQMKRINNITRANRRGGWARGRARPRPKPLGERRATGQLLMGSRVIIV